MSYAQTCPRCGADFADDDKEAVADAVVEHASTKHRHTLDRDVPTRATAVGSCPSMIDGNMNPSITNPGHPERDEGPQSLEPPQGQDRNREERC